MPNTSPRGRAFGIHQANGSDTITSLCEDIFTQGTDVTYNEAVNEIKAKVKDLLDDPTGIAEYTGVDPYTPGEDTIIDEAFYDFIAESLKCADIISFDKERPKEGDDYNLIEALGDAYDSEDGWDWEEVNDLVIEFVNDQDFLQDGEPHTHTHSVEIELADGTKHEVSLMLSPLGGAQLLWVMDSPYITPCASCSPCIPGAGDLDSPTGFFNPEDERFGAYDPAAGKYAHCLPPEWFKDSEDPIPYDEVYHYQTAFDSVAHQDFIQQVYPNPYTRVFFGAHRSQPLEDVAASIPRGRSESFIVIEDSDHQALQDLMHSDDVKIAITSNRFPTVFNDPDYPDLLVVWDAGEGPHNPYAYESDHYDNEGWLNLRVYPKALWDIVSDFATHRGFTNSYAVFWVRGDER